MAEEPTRLDLHRGMQAQKETDLRRLQAAVQADQAALRARQAELEDLLASAPAGTWSEAVDKVRYLLGLLRDSDAGSDPRRRVLIDHVLDELDQMLSRSHQS
jgi:hypothetical protein